MTTGVRLKYVNCWVDRRNGGARARYYFRRPGFKVVPLPGLPGSPEFMDAYQTALAGQALPRPMIGASRTKAGSLRRIDRDLQSFDRIPEPQARDTNNVSQHS